MSADSLTCEFRQVLAELEMLPHGTVVNWGATIGGVADSRPPTGESEPPHEVFRARYEHAVGHLKEKVLEEAREHLKEWRKRPDVKITTETDEELAVRIVKEGRGWTLAQVALHCRCSTTLARKARIKAGVTVDLGEGVPVLPGSDKKEYARELVERGLTERQVAMLTGLPKTTVRRLAGRSA